MHRTWRTRVGLLVLIQTGVPPPGIEPGRGDLVPLAGNVPDVPAMVHDLGRLSVRCHCQKDLEYAARPRRAAKAAVLVHIIAADRLVLEFGCGRTWRNEERRRQKGAILLACVLECGAARAAFRCGR